MKIGFIGAGKVGTSFGSYLAAHGHELMGYYSRSPLSAQRAAEVTGSRLYTELDPLVAASEIIFITTPDDAIGAVACQIGTLEGPITDKLFAHMSGAHSSRLLLPIIEKHPQNYLYSLHPLQAFASVERGVAGLPQTVFTLEGDSARQKRLNELVTGCGNLCLPLKGESKALYHAAACVASNYLVTLLHVSMELLEQAGIEARQGLEAMMPLILGSLENVRTLGAPGALTGPIARGDVETVKRHLSAMEAQCPELLPFYRQVGKETQRVAEKKPGRTGVTEGVFDNIWREGMK